MKKIFLFITVLCLSTVVSCTKRNSQISDYVLQTQNFQEKDIISIFDNIKKPEWEYVQSVVMPDFPHGKIGAVLFTDTGRNETCVAFFDSDGDFQQCSTTPELFDEPQFTYTGNGTVCFKLKSIDGSAYNYSLTIDIENGHTVFRAADDLGNIPSQNTEDVN